MIPEQHFMLNQFQLKHLNSFIGLVVSVDFIFLYLPLSNYTKFLIHRTTDEVLD